MSAGPQLFRVTPQEQTSRRLDEVEFAALGFQERRDIQEWVAANPRILGDDLLIVGKEFSGFDKTSERLDLLAVDLTGALVIIELKRDDSGADAHWQAIKYASYLRTATEKQVVDMLAKLESISRDEAKERLQSHLGAEELTGLNHDQRIILASHRFAPEVTSAALWLNDKAPGDALISCVTLTPFRDPETNSLYVQANTIIPVPTESELIVGIGDGTTIFSSIPNGTAGERAARRAQQNRSDDVSRFCWSVAELTLDGLPRDVRPDKTSRWAGSAGQSRFFSLWYARPPWRNYDIHYTIGIDLQSSRGTYNIAIGFSCYSDAAVEQAMIQAAEQAGTQAMPHGGTKHTYAVSQRDGVSLNADTVQWAADELRRAIEAITPAIDALADVGNQADEQELAEITQGGIP